MRRLGIATKVFLGFVAVLAVYLFVVAYGLYQLHQVREDTRLIHYCYVPIALTLGEARTDLASFEAMLNERDPRVLRRILQAQAVLQPFARSVRAKLARSLEFIAIGQDIDSKGYDRLLLQRGRQNIQSMLAHLDDFEARSERFRLALANDDWDLAAREQLALQAITVMLRETLSELSRAARAATSESMGRINASERDVRLGILVMTAIATLIAALVLFLILRTLKPIATLTQAAREVAHGNYSGRVPVRSQDEVALLATEFNRMADNILAREMTLRERKDALEKTNAELLALQRQEQRVRAELNKKERLAAIGRMTSQVTHELRNPLSALGLNVEILHDELREFALQPEHEAFILMQAIHKEIDRLTEITESYLAYAKHPVREPEWVDLSALVESLITFIQPDFARKGISLDCQITTTGLGLLGHESQVRRALLNLLKNAADATPPQGQVTLNLTKVDQQASITISDSGHGIDAETLEAIFEPFFTTKDGGTGLGLPLAHQIIEEHRGHIHVTSTPSAGTIFSIRLPLASPPNDARELGGLAIDPEL